MASKTKPVIAPFDSSARKPSQVEIAMLAAQWLPGIQLPDDWIKQPEKELSLTITATHRQFETRDGQTTVPDSKWEIVAREAISRAKQLLGVISGAPDPERGRLLAIGHRVEEARKTTDSEWSKLAKGRPGIAVLELVCHWVGNRDADQAWHYWRCFLKECASTHAVEFFADKKRDFVFEFDPWSPSVMAYLSARAFFPEVLARRRAAWMKIGKEDGAPPKKRGRKKASKIINMRDSAALDKAGRGIAGQRTEKK